MAASQFAVIYSQATGRVRCIHVHPEENETDATLSAAVKAGQGEAVQMFPASQIGDHAKVQALLNQMTGKVPASDRFAVIDKDGNVAGAFVMDPLCGDRVPQGYSVIKSDIAASGWKYANGDFTAPPKVAEVYPAPLPAPGVDNVGVTQAQALT